MAYSSPCSPPTWQRQLVTTGRSSSWLHLATPDRSPQRLCCTRRGMSSPWWPLQWSWWVRQPCRVNHHDVHGVDHFFFLHINAWGFSGQRENSGSWLRPACCSRVASRGARQAIKVSIPGKSDIRKEGRKFGCQDPWREIQKCILTITFFFIFWDMASAI